MKTFWIWVLVVWSFLFGLCGVIWSLYNSREINRIREETSITETYKNIGA